MPQVPGFIQPKVSKPKRRAKRPRRVKAKDRTIWSEAYNQNQHLRSIINE